jgi:hypothetical protein
MLFRVLMCVLVKFTADTRVPLTSDEVGVLKLCMCIILALLA